MASILLLEGDPDVRRLLLILLADLGHTAAALERDQDVPAGADLLLLDPTSRIHLEQARLAREQNAALPVVCMSFLQEEGRFLTTGGPFVHLLKPFTADELGAAIATALA
ncbi:MAG: hypothetical protein JWO56_41 [Acidobacteria bacterium]|nr:hypothetical protein [Acidobacteriota bacterium]